MEKTTVKDVVDLVEKAMHQNLKIKIFSNEIGIYKDNEQISIALCENMIYIWNKFGRFSIDVPEKSDQLKFELIVEKAKKYEVEKATNYFNNFFKDDESKPTDINDLDNEDD